MSGDLMLFAGSKSSVYWCAAFGSQVAEVAEVMAVAVPTRCGTLELVVRYRKPKARKWEGYRASAWPFVIVSGWGGPPPPSAMVPTADGRGLVTKWPCNDRRYREEFDRFVDAALLTSDRLSGEGPRLVADYRNADPASVEMFVRRGQGNFAPATLPASGRGAQGAFA